MATIEIPQLDIPFKTAESRERLYEAGEVADRLFVVRYGLVLVEWFRGGISDVLVAPAILGTEILAGRTTYDATVSTLSECSVQIIPGQDPEHIRKEYPWLRDTVSVLERDQKLKFLSRMDARSISASASIAKVLLDLAEAQGNLVDGVHYIEGVTQTVIANMAMLTRESVSKELGHNLPSKYVTLEGGGRRARRVKILDIEAFRFIAETGQIHFLKTNGHELI